MKKRNEYPKENTNKHTVVSEGTESVEENKENEIIEDTVKSNYEDEADSSHYSVGGDNGW